MIYLIKKTDGISEIIKQIKRNKTIYGFKTKNNIYSISDEIIGCSDLQSIKQFNANKNQISQITAQQIVEWFKK